MERKRVVITGMGAVTPIGCDVETYWNALISGKSGGAPIQAFDASEYNSRIAAEVKDYNPGDHFDRKEARRLHRFTQFAIVGARQAIEDSGLKMENEDPETIL